MNHLTIHLLVVSNSLSPGRRQESPSPRSVSVVTVLISDTADDLKQTVGIGVGARTTKSDELPSLHFVPLFPDGMTENCR